MHYCLNKVELRQLIGYMNRSNDIDDDYLRILIDNAENWQDELCCLNYIFSIILDRMVRNGMEGYDLIKILYEIDENMFFLIQEIDHNFIDFMIKNIRNPGLSLEDELIMLQNSIGDHRYESAVRY